MKNFSPGYSYDILEYQGTLFLAKQDGLYVKNSLPASLEHFSDLPVVQIGPNPTTAEINISCTERIEKVIIMNTAGQQAYSAAVGKNKFSFSPNLAKGIYVLDLELPNGRTII